MMYTNVAFSKMKRSILGLVRLSGWVLAGILIYAAPHDVQASNAESSALAAPKKTPEEELDLLDIPARELTPEYLAEMESLLNGVAASETTPGPSSGGSPGSSSGAPPGNFSLGSKLHGFDLTVLRSGARLRKFRYLFEDVRGNTGLPNQATVSLSCEIEFGQESGIAEIMKNAETYRSIFGDIIGQTTMQSLLSVSGKIELKESALQSINHRLTTAQAREIYITDMRIVPWAIDQQP